MRLLLLLLALAPSLAAQPAFTAAEPATPAEVVQAVEFPYYAYPRSLWERELVWMKTVGIRTVEFSVPWNWHQLENGTFDFSGSTSPRRDLVGFLRILHRLEMRAWIRPLPPVKGWINNGYPSGLAQDRRAARGWLQELERVLEAQTQAHGGPVAFLEGANGLNVPPPPAPIVAISALDTSALLRSRQALASARGSLLWEDVEDALVPKRLGAPRHSGLQARSDRTRWQRASDGFGTAPQCSPHAPLVGAAALDEAGAGASSEAFHAQIAGGSDRAGTRVAHPRRRLRSQHCQ